VYAPLKETEHPAYVFLVLRLPEDRFFSRQIRYINNGIGRENDLIREFFHNGQSLAAGIGLDGLFRIVEGDFGEATLSDREVIACSP
jgi:hypothetical protein